VPAEVSRIEIFELPKLSVVKVEGRDCHQQMRFVEHDCPNLKSLTVDHLAVHELDLQGVPRLHDLDMAHSTVQSTIPIPQLHLPRLERWRVPTQGKNPTRLSTMIEFGAKMAGRELEMEYAPMGEEE
jgi:hypothetical protein